MSERKSAFYGSFSDFKIIRTRSAAQFVIEVPLEQADAALAALGGLPQPGSERPVAVARLVEEPKPTAAANPFKSLQGKEAYANKTDMEKAVTRAALLCKDGRFRKFLGAPDVEGPAAAILCGRLNINSRREIGENLDAYRAFLNMEGQFQAYQQAAGYPEHWTGARQ